jgi:hypothetical protein
MSRHLKTKVISGIATTCGTFVAFPPVSAPRTRGVRYFVPVEGINAFWGSMNTVKEGYKYRKHIIVRRMPYAKGLLQLYTYHFPKTWSAACVANRELIKLAQRQAHALEHAHTPEALEWRLRFFTHYFRVCKGGAKPEPGLKPYTRFYQYTYVALYRQLQSARDAAQKAAQEPEINVEDITFEPVESRSVRPIRPVLSRTTAAHRAFQPHELDSDFILKPRAYLIC